MSEKEIIWLLEQWQIHQHCNEEEESLEIEKKLLKEAGFDMENNWYEILVSKGLLAKEN